MVLVGIAGGVGPEASNKFCEHLIKMKKKSCDQDNIPFIHYCNPQIPDRTEYILGKGENPTAELLRTCKVLEQSHVDFILIPCNTAHFFLKDLREEISTPIVDMIQLTVLKIRRELPSLKKIGLLATTGTVKSELYKSYLKRVGIEVVTPDDFYQESLVMEAIYGKSGIKAGKKKFAKVLLHQASEHLVSKGAEALILGCTELPLVLKQKDIKLDMFDPMTIAAQTIIGAVECSESKSLLEKTHSSIDLAGGLEHV